MFAWTDVTISLKCLNESFHLPKLDLFKTKHFEDPLNICHSQIAQPRSLPKRNKHRWINSITPRLEE
ncbi:hypothetical protein ACTXT7_003386 [Hymenolepis weldensis]